MDDGTSMAVNAIEAVSSNAVWLGADRWPDDIIDTTRFPAMSVARTPIEMWEIGRLRYELYIARDGKRYAHADHEARTFIEPIDQLSLNFAARAAGSSAVAVRATWASDAIVDPHLEQVVAHADLQSNDVDRTIVHSRLAVLPSMTARSLLPVLFQSISGALGWPMLAFAWRRPDQP